MKYKRKLLYLVIAVVTFGAVATPTTLLIMEKQMASHQLVLQSFAINYGSRGTLVDIQRVKDVYLVRWEDADLRYTMLYADGIWIELGGLSR